MDYLLVFLSALVGAIIGTTLLVLGDIILGTSMFVGGTALIAFGLLFIVGSVISYILFMRSPR